MVEVVLVHRHRQLGVALGHLQGGAGELQAEVGWGFDLWLVSLFSRIILLEDEKIFQKQIVLVRRTVEPFPGTLAAY